MKRALLARLEATYDGYLTAAESVLTTQKYLEASGEQARIADVKYVNGLMSYQDWYIIENDYVNARKNLLNAQGGLATAEAAWKNLLGQGD